MYAMSGCMLHTAQSAEGEWVVVQPALSIGGLGGGGDRWWRRDGASPLGPVGDFITSRAALVSLFLTTREWKSGHKIY